MHGRALISSADDGRRGSASNGTVLSANNASAQGAVGGARGKRHITLPEGRAILEDGGGFMPTVAGRAAASRAFPLKLSFFTVNVHVSGDVAAATAGGASSNSSQSSATLSSELGIERMRSTSSSSSSLVSLSSSEGRRAGSNCVANGGAGGVASGPSGSGWRSGAGTPVKGDVVPKAHACAEGGYVAFNFGHTVRCFPYACNGKGINRRNPLDQLAFEEATPTCVDVNLMTRSPTNVDSAIGLSTGEIVLRNMVTKATRRLNKDGTVTASSPTCIRWVPGSDGLFVVACADGALYVYDADRDRNDLQPLPLPSAPPLGNASISAGEHRSPTDGLTVVHAKGPRLNPLARWHFGTAVGAVSEIAFSPDCKHLAIASKDGKLRVCDFVEERVVQCFKSYFGGLNCVAWSPDGKFILTGGEDDLVSVWSFEEARLLMRCQGHMSWVSAVAFDPYTSDHSTYRFGSAGQDTRLLVWEFTRASISRPRLSSLLDENELATPPSRALDAVPLIAPIVNQCIHSEPLTALAFRSDAIVTGCHGGEVRVWARPTVTHADAPALE